MLKHQRVAIEAILNASPPAEGELLVRLDWQENWVFLTPAEAIQRVKDQPRTVFEPQFYWELK